MTGAELRLYGRLTGVQCYHKFDSEHEFEWDRVQRRRREGKCNGRNYHVVDHYESQWDRAWTRAEAIRQHKKIRS